MLIAEDLLLLLTDDDTGKLAASPTRVDIALGGAMLVDLALARRIAIGGDGRLLVIDRSPTSDALLDDALSLADKKQHRKPKDVVRPLGSGLRGQLYRRLADRGLVKERDGRVLGIFPVHVWPAVDAAHENAVRVELAQALGTGTTTDAHTGALIALLHALKAASKVFDAATIGLTTHELDANAERIAEGDWASAAVRDAIRQLMAVMVAASSAAGASAAV